MTAKAQALLLGVDGGGSKTRALVADRDGNVLGTGSAGRSNYHAAGLEKATQAIAKAVSDALGAAGVKGTLAAACFGLAGVYRPRDRALLEGWVQASGLASTFTVVNDAELVIAGGTPDLWGVGVICGTGSICLGRSVKGETARAGGWGYLLGDEGSGYSLGEHALRLAAQTADGRTDAGGILEAVLQQWGLSDADELLGYVYRPEMTHTQVAQLAPTILKLWHSGDAHATRLVDRTAIALGRLIESVVTKLSMTAPPIAFGGGLLVHNPDLQELIVRRTRVELGPQKRVEDPALGALLLAKRLAETAPAPP
jgi:N-acetylglucosamine kinase-like BadF-type ATPase